MITVKQTKKELKKMTNGILEQVEDMVDFGEQEIRDYEKELFELWVEEEENSRILQDELERENDDYDSDFEDLD